MKSTIDILSRNIDDVKHDVECNPHKFSQVGLVSNGSQLYLGFHENRSSNGIQPFLSVSYEVQEMPYRLKDRVQIKDLANGDKVNIGQCQVDVIGGYYKSSIRINWMGIVEDMVYDNNEISLINVGKNLFTLSTIYSGITKVGVDIALVEER
ncbi:MAG: hypothetical protein H6621_11900 [Halobacteriovoraceae bacterium]|nr:hypothetical protein [Halobacteriovoraceae bacterium]MCB9095764.1 hypothetical protein [Halobacteriovoraceae bacterium]